MQPGKVRHQTSCELCGRKQPLTFHHLIPRRNHRKGWFGRHFSEGGTDRRGLMLYGLCQSATTLDLTYAELELGQRLNTREAILDEPEIQRFLRWARKQR